MARNDRLRPIEGRHNALVKELRRAFSQAEATPDGYVALEGFRVLEEAIRSGLRFKAVLFSESAEPRAQRILPQLGAHVETALLPDKIFAGAVPTESPQGVAALVRLKEFTMDDILARAQAGPLLAVAALQDPGNLGTIFRSAEAFGAAGLLLGPGTVSPLNAKVVRASAGSVFRVPFVRAEMADSLDPLRERGLRLIATSSHNGIPLDEVKLSGPAAVFVGNEGAGLDRTLTSRMDEMIVIPHAQQVESLNAGVAASIVLYEIARQRRLLTAETQGQRERRTV